MNTEPKKVAELIYELIQHGLNPQDAAIAAWMWFKTDSLVELQELKRMFKDADNKGGLIGDG